MSGMMSAAALNLVLRAWRVHFRHLDATACKRLFENKEDGGVASSFSSKFWFYGMAIQTA